MSEKWRNRMFGNQVVGEGLSLLVSFLCFLAGDVAQSLSHCGIKVALVVEPVAVALLAGSFFAFLFLAHVDISRSYWKRFRNLISA